MSRASRRWRAVRTGVVAGLVTGTMLTGATGAPASAQASASTQLAKEQVLYDFAGPNGAGPLAGVSLGADGALYGTTVFGGRHGDGDVYELTPDGSGYTETILHTFGGPDDGSKPGGNVVANNKGDLFGVTTVGGADQQGTAFELVLSGSRYTETAIHTFTGGPDGSQSIGTLVMNTAGDLFGVTQFGGTSNGDADRPWDRDLHRSIGGGRRRQPFRGRVPGEGRDDVLLE